MKARSWLRRTEQQDSEENLEFWKDSPMASFVFECFFCLLPFLLVLLLSVAPRWPRVHYWTNRAVKAAGWRLWVIICWILELPPSGNTSAWTKEAASPGTDFLTGSGRGSEGLRVICKPTALAKYLQRHCYPLFHLRLASWPRGDLHLQTLSNMLYETRAGRLQFTRDHLLLRDGGVVALDWAVGTQLVEASGRRRKECQSTGKALGCFTAAPPVLLVIPQYWGGMTPHLKVLCHQAVQQGFYVVVFHARGTAGCPLTTTRLTEFGDPADLEQVWTKINEWIKQPDMTDGIFPRSVWNILHVHLGNIPQKPLRRGGSFKSHIQSRQTELCTAGRTCCEQLKAPFWCEGRSLTCVENRDALQYVTKLPAKPVGSWKKKAFCVILIKKKNTIVAPSTLWLPLFTSLALLGHCKTSKVGAFQERSSGFQTWHLSAASWLPGKVPSKKKKKKKLVLTRISTVWNCKRLLTIFLGTFNVCVLSTAINQTVVLEKCHTLLARQTKIFG